MTFAPNHNVAWELVHPEPCGCDQSLALTKRLDVCLEALDAIRCVVGAKPGSALELASPVEVIGSILALAEANLGRLK